MELDTWLRKNGISANQVAYGIGVSPMTVSFWRRGRSIPRGGNLKSVVALTGSEVTEADFARARGRWLKRRDALNGGAAA